jgi:beta-1,4-mannosyl-glycoprotein beta-1,4-N-acetylglucosaminyltransferase
MIVDAFTFFDELDTLEIRLHTLAPVVDRFVLVEAARTFTGLAKPLHFLENQDRFAPFLDRITRVTARNLSSDDPWDNENMSRNAIAPYVDGDDIVLLSDVDEIPRPEIVEQLAAGELILPIVMDIDHFIYFYDLQLLAEKLGWIGTCAFRAGDLRQHDVRWHRYHRSDFNAVFNAGWHFSYMGGSAAVQNKLRSFSHAFDIDDDGEQRQSRSLHWIRVEMGAAMAGRSRLGPTRRADRAMLPSYIRDNPERWKGQLLP